MKSSKSKNPTTIKPRFLRKEIKQLENEKAHLEWKRSIPSKANQVADLEIKIISLKKQIEKLHLTLERVINIDRIADNEQIQRYKKLPKNSKTEEYINNHKQSFYNKLNAPDKVWCSDGKIRTKREAEAWRILKPA